MNNDDGRLIERLDAVMALLAEATPGELSVYDANDGDGWPPRPLWCFKNDAYDSDAEDVSPLQGSVHYGGKEDAEAIAAAVNLLRQHGPALADLARRWEESKPVRVVSDDIGNHIDLETWHKSNPQPGLYRIVPDMGEG